MDTFELELTGMAHGGRALGRHEGRTIFVPYGLPGERVEVRITEDRGKIAFAQIVRLLGASDDRVQPRCPHFGRSCCSNWQHIDYPAQLLLKQDVLNDQLQRIAGLTDDQILATVQPVIPSALTWNYNHHMVLHVGQLGQLGLPGVDERIVPLDLCVLMQPDLLALYDSLDMTFTGVRRIRLQTGTDGAGMLILYMIGEDAPELETDLPVSINIVLEDNEPVNLIGDSHSRFVVRGRTFRVTAGSSFRAHVAQIDPLIDVVLDSLGDTQRVLDLYAGVGVFSAFIAPRVRLVTLVDSYPPAVSDADENLADLDNVDVLEGSVEEALETLDVRYDAAVLDPGSAGLSTEAIDRISDAAIPRLVYVSSDPATLARDLKRLAGHGYQLHQARPIDLAPQTYYVDTVAVLQRE